MTADQNDPMVRAITDVFWPFGNAPRIAAVAVTAVRRAVLDRRPDAETLGRIRGWINVGHAGPAAATVSYLLAALADETMRADLLAEQANREHTEP